MPKQQRSQGKGKPKLQDRNFGKALIRRQLMGNQGLDGRDTKEQKNMLSVLDTCALDDFVSERMLGDQDPEVLRGSEFEVTLITPQLREVQQELTLKYFDYEHLKIPRKPAWSKTMTAEDVDRNEKDAFLQWRRDIANLESNSMGTRKVTPFEKNIEVWRQLWRVIERCDMAVQIIDARNPLLYYTKDLVTYASELSRPVVLIINKSDFLTDFQRQEWAKYFNMINVRFIFYSAFFEQSIIDESAQELSRIGELEGRVPLNPLNQSEADEIRELASDIAEASGLKSSCGSKKTGSTAAAAAAAAVTSAIAVDDGEQSEFVWGDESCGGISTKEKYKSTKVSSKDSLDDLKKAQRSIKVLTRAELLYFFVTLPSEFGINAQEKHHGRICIGMVGYPNVGKSSVINSIMGNSKASHGVVRVGVSSTPGKTKHFQTLVVNDDLMLCDCPGLVFPSFMRSVGEMVCSGILPINQIRDYKEPAEIITARVPINQLEATYSIKITRHLDVRDNPNRPPTYSEFLSAYCSVKGYIAPASGNFDEFRACKDILKDFNDGRLLFVAHPPLQKGDKEGDDDDDDIGKDIAGIDVQRWQNETEKILMQNDKIRERLELQRLNALDIGMGGIEDLDRGVAAGMVFDFEAEGGEGVILSSITPQESALTEGNVFSFGNDTASTTPKIKFDDESSSDENEDDEGLVYTEGESILSISGAARKGGASAGPKREHKKLQKWGKKNKKNRDLTPYADGNGTESFVAYTTNRSEGARKHVQGEAFGSEKAGIIAIGRKRHDPKVLAGAPITRPTLPSSYSK